jgi:energy-coupling factor transporter ATP-binding protein EcfA2
VIFEFLLEGKEVDEALDIALKKLLISDKDNAIFEEDGKKISAKDFLQSTCGLYISNQKLETKYISNWDVKKVSYKSLRRFMKPKANCGLTFQDFEGKLRKFLEFKIVETDGLSDSDLLQFDDAKPEDVCQVLLESINELVLKKLPNVVYWEYSDKYLLPKEVSLTNFGNGPDAVCLPLKYMFELSGVSKIKETIAEEKAKEGHSLRQLLKRVAQRTTEHIHEVWREYKDIKIELTQNGDSVEIAITDDLKDEASTPFLFTQRSDGFRRFVTFLIMISARVKANLLTEKIILIDEPDISLHPSGAKYLLEELIRISEKNIVVFSTHSTFMIDKKNIARHLIVEKKKEVTNIRHATESNIYAEEVLFQALNCSVFDGLKKKNVVFEGWHDSQLFQFALKHAPKAYAKLKKKFDAVGWCHGRGVSSLGDISVLFQAGRRGCVLVSDNDAQAISAQKKHLENRGFGEWLKYGDVLADTSIVTGEDYLALPFYKKIAVPLMNEIHKRESMGGPRVSSGDFDGPKGIVEKIEKWLDSQKLNPELRKKIKNEIKVKIFDSLTADAIKAGYYEMLDVLAQRTA